MKYVKILNEELNHNGFQYKEGLNVDTNKFNPSGRCEKGGLYFCEIGDFPLYLEYGNYIADVEIPHDALVYREPNKLKANKIIISNIRHISEMKELEDDKFQLNAFYQNSKIIEYIKNPSEDIHLALIRQSVFSIAYIKNPSRKVQLEAVRKFGYAIQYIKNSSIEVQLEAVRQNGTSIKFIRNPYLEVQLEAVRRNNRVLKLIDNPSAEVQLAASKLNHSSIKNY